MNSKLLLIAVLSLNSAFILKGLDEEKSEIAHSLSRTASEEEVVKNLKNQLQDQQPSQNKISMGSIEQQNQAQNRQSCLAACLGMFCSTK